MNHWLTYLGLFDRNWLCVFHVTHKSITLFFHVAFFYAMVYVVAMKIFCVTKVSHKAFHTTKHLFVVAIWINHAIISWPLFVLCPVYDIMLLQILINLLTTAIDCYTLLIRCHTVSYVSDNAFLFLPSLKNKSSDAIHMFSIRNIF